MCAFTAPLLRLEKKRERKKKYETEHWCTVDKVVPTGEIVRHSHGVEGQGAVEKSKSHPLHWILVAITNNTKPVPITDHESLLSGVSPRFNARFTETERGVPCPSK